MAPHGCSRWNQLADGAASSRVLRGDACRVQESQWHDGRAGGAQLLATGPARRCEPPPSPRSRHR